MNQQEVSKNLLTTETHFTTKHTQTKSESDGKSSDKQVEQQWLYLYQTKQIAKKIRRDKESHYALIK
jgi:hypothetical protein